MAKLPYVIKTKSKTELPSKIIVREEFTRLLLRELNNFSPRDLACHNDDFDAIDNRPMGEPEWDDFRPF